MPNKTKYEFKHILDFKLFEKMYQPNVGEYFTILYHITNEPTPVRIEKVYHNDTYLVSFNVDGSSAKGAPNQVIRNSDIISPYKSIRTPVGPGYITNNTNFQVRNTSNVNQVSNDMYL